MKNICHLHINQMDKNNSGFWVIVMSQYMFSNYNKCSTLMIIGNRGVDVYVETGCLWKISGSSS